MSKTETTEDPRIAAVRRHFREWHGLAPDDVEIDALLRAIDARDAHGIEDTMRAMEREDGR